MADNLWLHLIISTALASVNHGHAQIKKRKTLVLGSMGPTEETQGYCKQGLPGRRLPGEMASGSEHGPCSRGISAFLRGQRYVRRMGR